MNSTGQFDGVFITKQKRSAVCIKIQAQLIEVHFDNEVKTFEISKLDISLGGNKNNLMYFNLKNDQDQSFYLHISTALFRHLGQFSNKKYKNILQARKADFRRSVVSVGTVLIGILVLFGLLSALKKPIVDKIANSISLDVEHALGEQLIKVYLPPNKVINNKEINEQFKLLLIPLLNTYEIKKDIQVYISSDSDLNAFALPGGYIVFNSGLLLASESAEEVLGVAAHELAHVTERHVLRGIIQSGGLFLMVQTLLGDMTGVIAIIMENSSQLLSLSFSRDHEMRADEVGFTHLVEAGIDPRGLTQFFERLKQKESGTQKKYQDYLQFISTHPMTQDRIDKNKLRYEELSYDIKNNILKQQFNYKDFKTLLKQ